MTRASPDFTVRGQRGYLRLGGCVSANDAFEMVSSAIEACRERGADELLADLTKLDERRAPTAAERYRGIAKWAAIGRGCVRLAIVVGAAIIDAQKFGVTVARNRGLTADIFTSEAEAMDWLDEGRKLGGRRARREVDER